MSIWKIVRARRMIKAYAKLKLKKVEVEKTEKDKEVAATTTTDGDVDVREQVDHQAARYMLLFGPVVGIAYAVYSLFYRPHASFYAWGVDTLMMLLYTLGL